MVWLWKWLESYNNWTFSAWKGIFLFNILFWIPNSICTFHDYARELGLADGRYFTANLAEAGILKISPQTRYFEKK